MTGALPLLDVAAVAAGHPAALRSLHDSCRDVGTVLLSGVAADLRAAPVALARRFFAIDQDTKRSLDIARSPHFRGYSVMHNERDWREQFHVGPEGPPRSAGVAWRRLEGPNLWPPDDALRVGTLAVMRRVACVGAMLLAALASARGLPAEAFAAPPDDAYTLLKFIRYHAQVGDGVRRRGVAAHCDFSWLTLLFQDDVGGLQVMDRAGRWIDVAASPDVVVVNVGELLQFATSGALFAAPHRVINPSSTRDRLSVPVFINPALDCAIARADVTPAISPWIEATHVHRVLPVAQIHDPGARYLHFGHAEWRRKGENIWCAACCAQ